MSLKKLTETGCLEQRYPGQMTWAVRAKGVRVEASRDVSISGRWFQILTILLK